MQESRYTKSKTSGFNVSSGYVLKSDMDRCSLVDAVLHRAYSMCQCIDDSIALHVVCRLAKS